MEGSEAGVDGVMMDAVSQRGDMGSGERTNDQTDPRPLVWGKTKQKQTYVQRT